tara:strand:- start:73157 stop:73831 length:675 start_codon:yes stop_codon:yes gene_type:complete
MFTLSIDVITDKSIITIWCNKTSKIRASSSLNTLNNSCEIIIPQIETLLSRAKLNYNDLHDIITVVGPGNYTNIRVGIATASGISIALKIPSYGITQHEVIARSYKKPIKNGFYTLVHSTKENFYIQEFDSGKNPLNNINIFSFNDLIDKFKNTKIPIIERGNHLLSLVINRNIDLDYLESNYHIPPDYPARIASLIDPEEYPCTPKYILKPNVKKSIKSDVYG